MSKFQIVLLSAFGFFIIVAVLVFALYRGSGSAQATITVWGDLPASDFAALENATLATQDKNLVIRYVAKPAASLEAEWTEALAQGNGPDLIILSQDKFWQNKNKLIPIPYESISANDFRDTFVEAGEIFLTPEGVYALPLTIDPLVLYYNRDLLSGAGVAKPIEFWDEIYNSTLNLSKRDAAGNLTRSTIALGETKNINNFKGILSLLILQAGSTITGFSGDELRSLLSYGYDLPMAPAVSALDFYTQFSNPSKPYYSWNRTLPEAQARFTSGDAAYYIGFASELRALRNKNPTLNFSLAPVPQSRVSERMVTFGKLKGVAISKGTGNSSAALSGALKLISKDSARALSQILVLPPVRRDLLSERQTDAVFPVFYNGALQAKAWIDPNDEGTEQVFRDMVDSVTSGRARTTEAVNKASRELEALIK